MNDRVHKRRPEASTESVERTTRAGDATRLSAATRALLPASLIAFAATPAHAAGQLVLIPDPTLLAVMLVGFVVLIFPVNSLIFKPIFQALDERSARIQGARDRAAHIQRDADKILAQYEARIREARNEAAGERKEHLNAARDEQLAVTASARTDAEQQIEAARAALASELVTARQTMRDESRQLAREAAERILGRAL